MGVISIAQQQIMLVDGCYGSVVAADCALVYHGVFSKGAHAAALVYADLVRTLVSQRLSMPANSTVVVLTMPHVYCICPHAHHAHTLSPSLLPRVRNIISVMPHAHPFHVCRSSHVHDGASRPGS
jgi:hypothetical protein